MKRLPRDREGISILNARHGDFRLLEARLRDGRATSFEMQIAADIIGGKVTKKRGGQIDVDGFERALDIEQFVRSLILDEGYKNKKDAAVKAAEAKFRLSKTRVYAALKQAASYKEMRTKMRKAVSNLGDDDFG